jgi:hypothetical protein
MSPDQGGPAVEKWILRALLAVTAVLFTAAVIGSRNEIKRYAKMRTM